MPTASRNERKLRRVKVELRKTRKLAEIAISQRDQARLIAMALERELKKHDPPQDIEHNEKVNPDVVMEKVPEVVSE
jgi:hypothetical protein